MIICLLQQMVDPDAPSRKEPTYREWRHWLVVNVPNHSVKDGHVLSSYKGKHPSIGRVSLSHSQSRPHPSQGDRPAPLRLGRVQAEQEDRRQAARRQERPRQVESCRMVQGARSRLARCCQLLPGNPAAVLLVLIRACHRRSTRSRAPLPLVRRSTCATTDRRFKPVFPLHLLQLSVIQLFLRFTYPLVLRLSLAFCVCALTCALKPPFVVASPSFSNLQTAHVLTTFLPAFKELRASGANGPVGSGPTSGSAATSCCTRMAACARATTRSWGRGRF